MKLKELFTDESKWTKGSYARDQDGLTVDPQNDKAVCWCFRGAMYKIGFNIHSLTHIFEKLFPDGVMDWNDAPERTFEDIKKLVEELDI